MTVSTSSVLGYDVLNLDSQSCVKEIIVWLDIERGSNSSEGKRWLACLNPHSYVVALNDKAYFGALQSADWLIPDGVGIVMASRLLGGTIKERVTGSDVFYGLSKQLNALSGFKVFFLGSTEDVLGDIRARMAVDYPNVAVVGTYSPPFKPEYTEDELQEMVDVVNLAAPDVLWIGMTAPKQEKWIADTIDRLDVTFVAAIGAVFDFYTERVRRSHPIFQRLGLEWLPRLLQQPKRLWRRMFVSAPIFVWHVLVARLGLGRAEFRLD